VTFFCDDYAMDDLKILIVDDDQRLRELLLRYLGDQGFSVRAVDSATTLDRAIQRERFDLIVLDLMLPGEDGLSICRRLRAGDPGQAIIIGLEMGADDYLPKPFNPRELVARIHAVMRRRRTAPPGSPAAEQALVSFGDVEIDLAARTLTRAGDTQSLTTGEFAVLKALLDHPRQPLSRDRLTQLARGREHLPFDRAIDVQMSRLRKLVEPDPSQPRYLQTIWGHGYVFVPDGVTDR
jgi:two-component system OmpR family response regulator/two-component system phosphate regulon response regulator OmpR